ncbi:MAG: DUF948 domain-containing protein [Jatrophihabitans sp.]|uniref:DUF948 domain-containing protein n=1 Tax=Jatrophihabitans sp. TaxID=1932789 RepID=UPI003F815E79
MLALAALIGAVAFAALVALLAVPLLKAGRTLDEASLTLRAARETPVREPQPIEVARVVVERADAPSPPAAPGASATPPVLGAVVSSTLAGPLGETLIKAAAYGHGVRASVQKRLEPAPSRPTRSKRKR